MDEYFDKNDNFFDKIKKSESFKNSVIESLCKGIDSKHENSFKYLMQYVINKSDMFEIPEFDFSLHNENVKELILPTIRRVFARIFINSPDILSNTIYNPNDLRSKLFVLYFDIDDFLSYLIDIFIKTKDCLKEFEYIDRTVETLNLIVDNYVSMLINKVLGVNMNDLESEIKKVLTQNRREDLLNYLNIN